MESWPDTNTWFGGGENGGRARDDDVVEGRENKPCGMPRYPIRLKLDGMRRNSALRYCDIFRYQESAIRK